MDLQSISNEEFGKWYRSAVENIQIRLALPHSSNDSLKSLESKIEAYLDVIKEKSSRYSDSELLAQYDQTRNLNSDEYERLESRLLPSFIVYKSGKTSNGRTSTGVSLYNGEMPVMIAKKSENQKNILDHETQHLLYRWLTNEDLVDIDGSQSKNDQGDFWMYKNELLSKLIGYQTPIGYTLNINKGTRENQFDYTTKYSLMMYDVYKLAVKSAKNRGVDSDNFIKDTFLSTNFEELFYNSVALANGGSIKQYEFDEISFVDNKHKEYFLKCISVE